MSGAPQSLQNFAPGLLFAPQRGHFATIGEAHSLHKFAPSGFSAEQFWQRIEPTSRPDDSNFNYHLTRVETTLALVETTLALKDDLTGVCSFRHPLATAEQIVSVFLAGVLGERLIARNTDVEAANTDVREAAKFARNVDLNVIAAKTRLRIYNLWTEVARLAEALEKRGSLDAGEIARAARMPPLSWTT